MDDTYVNDLNEAIKILKNKCNSKILKPEDKTRIQYFKALIYAISTYHSILKDRKRLEKPEPEKEEPDPFLLNIMELMKTVKKHRENPSFHTIQDNDDY